MQLATIANTNTQTMSSREISDLTGKELSHIHRDIRAMVGALEDDPVLDDLKEDKDVRGYTTVFHLNKELTLTLVAGYNVKLRLAIVKRWQELEAQVKPAFTLPQTFAQALALAAQQALELEQKQLQLEAAKPKVEYVDKYVERNNLKSITDVAKEMGISSKALGVWLRKKGHAWTNKIPVRWTQPFMDKGYGEMKQYTTNGGFDGTQAMFTAAGDVFVKQEYK